MSLDIDRLNLSLPSSLGNRKLAITRLLNGELARFTWPENTYINQLSPDALQISARSTNLHIARAIARSIHRATVNHTQSAQGGVL